MNAVLSNLFYIVLSFLALSCSTQQMNEKMVGVPNIKFISDRVWSNRRACEKQMRDCHDKLILAFKEDEAFMRFREDRNGCNSCVDLFLRTQPKSSKYQQFGHDPETQCDLAYESCLNDFEKKTYPKEIEGIVDRRGIGSYDEDLQVDRDQNFSGAPCSLEWAKDSNSAEGLPALLIRFKHENPLLRRAAAFRATEADLTTDKDTVRFTGAPITTVAGGCPESGNTVFNIQDELRINGDEVTIESRFNCHSLPLFRKTYRETAKCVLDRKK